MLEVHNREQLLLLENIIESTLPIKYRQLSVHAHLIFCMSEWQCSPVPCRHQCSINRRPRHASASVKVRV